MLPLVWRMVRGGRPADLAVLLLLAAASAGAALLLLGCLARAADSADDAGRAALGCLLGTAAGCWSVSSLAALRAALRGGRRRALGLAGCDHRTLRLLHGTETALVALLGSAAAVALLLLGHRTGPGRALLGPGHAAFPAGIPPAAALTLLLLVPLIGGLAAGLTLRPAPAEAEDEAADGTGSVTADGTPAGREQPAGPVEQPSRRLTSRQGFAAAGVLGLVLMLLPERMGTAALSRPITLPGELGELGALDPLPAAGWLLALLGLPAAAQLMLRLSGGLLAARGGASALVAGRIVQGEAAGLGRPIGALTVLLAISVAAARLLPEHAERAWWGPLLLGVFLTVACCLPLSLGAATARARGAHRRALADLHRAGLPSGSLRRCATGVLAASVAVLLCGGWLLGLLAGRIVLGTPQLRLPAAGPLLAALPLTVLVPSLLLLAAASSGTLALANRGGPDGG
jgi:hypothetical protein